jgi:hypothetical protein
MKELSYEIWMPLKFLHQGLRLPSPSIQCRLEWYTSTKLKKKKTCFLHHQNRNIFFSTTYSFWTALKIVAENFPES